MKSVKTSLICALSLCTLQLSAKSKNYLSACWEKQVKPLTEGQYISFHYQEKLNELEHSFEPWQQTNFTGNGFIYFSADDFIKQDTLVSKKRVYYSKTQLNPTTLLFLDYGDKDLFPVTKNMFAEQPFKIARYTPTLLINYFVQHNATADKESNKDFAVYKLSINTTIVKLYINKSNKLLSKVTTLSNDELFGDVRTTYVYKDYQQLSNKLYYTNHIDIDKITGKIQDEVTISSANISHTVPTLLVKPADYALKDEKEVIPEIIVEKYNDHIHFIGMKHTDDKVMIVEFRDFLLVAEAPLNSKNGELIIAEARKIAPGKPVKYFTYSHYHPHYTGGIRPFVHTGATIITTDGDTAYIKYLATAPHTIQPDSLQIDPKSIKMEVMQESKTITDGNYEMKIYFIGNKSKHTNDYRICYFPAEKLLFEGDLAGLAKEGPIKKAGSSQLGLYNSVKDLGLDVTTIIQSWPVRDYGFKTEFSFNDLLRSVEVK